MDAERNFSKAIMGNTLVVDDARSRTRALRREVPLKGIDDQVSMTDPFHLARFESVYAKLGINTCRRHDPRTRTP